MWFLQPGITISDVLMRILASLVIILLIMPIHEFSHGFIAYKLGDKTAKHSGRLTLNPLSHFDTLGAISILIFDIGWAKPVPVNARNFKNPRRDMAITALFGPLSNIIAAILGAVILNGITLFMPQTLGMTTAISKFLSYYTIINISLAAFNFLPIPPLDGYKILECSIPQKYLTKYYQYYPMILIILLGLMLFGFFDIPLLFIRVSIYNVVMKLGSLPFIAWI